MLAGNILLFGLLALRSVHANDIEVVRLRPIPPGQPKERFFRIL